MKNLSIRARLKKAKPMAKKRVTKALGVYNTQMEVASYKIQKQNRGSVVAASHARITKNSSL